MAQIQHFLGIEQEESEITIWGLGERVRWKELNVAQVP